MTIDPEKIRPIEARGWFRWLHCHFYSRQPWAGFSNVEEAGFDWAAVTLLDDLGDWKSWINPHLWTIGDSGNRPLLEAIWDDLTPQQRGTALAGFSENRKSEDWIAPRLAGCSFDALATSQLVCNALLHRRGDIIPDIFRLSTDLSGSVIRYASPSRREIGPSDTAKKLSVRCIDMILEAALIQENLATVRLALDHGADPNIPIWVADRTYTDWQCALSYSIKIRLLEAADLLLDAGAEAVGTPFCTPNLPLFHALKEKRHDLILRLLENGASFAIVDPDDVRHKRIRRVRQELPCVISPMSGYFFCHSREDLDWARTKFGPLIPFVPVEEKPCFYLAHASGFWTTFLNVADCDIATLEFYRTHGLDIRPSEEEFLALFKLNAFDILRESLSSISAASRAKVLFRLRRRNPEFGIATPLDVLPQADGINAAPDFDPGVQEPCILPDGSRLYVDLDAIAPPGHNHGGCPEGCFLHLWEKGIFRRRGDHTIMKCLVSDWVTHGIPKSLAANLPGLPIVRWIDGQFIRLGCTAHDLEFLRRKPDFSEVVTTWLKSPKFRVTKEEMLRRIAAQDASNSRFIDDKPSKEELKNYPEIFHPILRRQESGRIGMPAIMAHRMRTVYEDFQFWEKRNRNMDGIVGADRNDRNVRNSHQDVIREAEGLRVLERDREAEALLRTVPEGSEVYVEARAVLAATLLNSPDCAEAAEWGPDLVRKNPENMRLALNVAGCIMNSGNPKAAVEMSRPWFGQMNSGVKLLNYSQVASAAECDSDAAAALTRLFRNHWHCTIQSLMDGIIRSFWERALARPIDEPTCIHLAAPAFPEFCESVEPLDWLGARIDYACLKQVPESLRQWIHKDYGFFNIRPDAPTEVLDAYREWQNEMAAKSLSLIMQVAEKATGQLLDRQLSLAINAATRGDFYSARIHALHELAFRPEKFDEYAQALPPLGMQYLIDDLEKLPDLKLLRSMRWEIPRLIARNAHNAAIRLYDCLPDAVGETVVGKLLRIQICRITGKQDEEPALRIEMLKCWPLDPSPYFNLIQTAIRTGNWSEAEMILASCPPAFRFFKAAPAIRESIKIRQRLPGVDVPVDFFYGQPGIGGLIAVEAADGNGTA